ncbi:hypothetical protein RHMOL_Rhmol09G0236700 [Rhododendron molle]|uniref:Uncharacterized protein n=1 Tax=Rhododendron molle TaxID=49168 RepID=A0ACC0MHP7_RHOML|nr:hypothetical protein RHMOL_Rhmol09G0236700 [Rhododendron molle]
MAVSLCAYTGSPSVVFLGVRVANPSSDITYFSSGLTLLLNWNGMRDYVVVILSRLMFTSNDLSIIFQSAALMSVGLLYEGSAHPQTMHILLAETGCRSGGDNVLEREGYAVFAGFSLGLVALGRGEDALGFIDTFVERLFQYVGGKEPHNERSLLVTLSADDHNRAAGQMMDGMLVNVDVTAPGAIIALALMFLKSESELVFSRLSIPCTHFDLQYVRPDFIMLRVIARNLIMWSRVHPSKDWIQSQIPEIVQNGIRGLGDEMGDVDEMDAEAFVQAYVNIVVGSCISIGLRFAGTKNGDAQELLYDYAIYFLNEVQPPQFAAQVVSLAIGFLFLGGGMRTFSTSSNSIAVLLISLYPRLPTGPNDNRCHLQAFRHLYVLATEARWLQTVDVDTGLPVYAPLEMTIKETEHYGETSFCEVTPCILPERATLKIVRVCGPRYWPQVIELVPEDKPWWSTGDKIDPFNSGVLYIKRKVGSCSYVDDPVGCQSLLSRAMHKVFGLTSLRSCTPSTNDSVGAGAVTIDQLVSTFSSDPSLIAFAQLCCDPSWNSRRVRISLVLLSIYNAYLFFHVASDGDFQEFCLQVLFECVSKDRPALLQVYLSLYTMLGCVGDQVSGGSSILSDSLFLSSLKLALAYNEALLEGKFPNSRGGIIQSTFLGSLRKRVEELLNHYSELENDLQNYLKSGRWPDENSQHRNPSTLLALYLQWYGVPPPSAVKTAIEKIKRVHKSSSVPLLRLLFPRTRINAIREIDKLSFSP